MPDQVTTEIKSSREKLLAELRDRMSARVLDSYIGKELDVMIEEYKDTVGAIGHSANFIEIALPGAPKGLHGHILKVLCKNHEDGILFAEIL